MNYSRSHIYTGVELMSMCFLFLAANECHGDNCNYGAMVSQTRPQITLRSPQITFRSVPDEV